MTVKLSSIEIRKAKLSDIPEILKVERAAWGEDKAATEGMFASRINTFSEGTLVAIVNETIVGVVSTEMINYDEGAKKNWCELTDDGLIAKTHVPVGDTIYGVDVSVHPSYQKRGVCKKLLESIGKIAIKKNVKQAMLGCRIPDYHKFAHKIKVEDYVRIVEQGACKDVPPDPELILFNKLGLKIVQVVPEYFQDPESLNYGVLLVWKNHFHNKWYRSIASKMFRV